MTDDELRREREAFEPWALSEDFNLKRSPTYPENYIYSDTSSAFEGWLGRALLAASAPNPSDKQEAVAFIEGDEAQRVLRWNKNIGAFNYAIGTPLYAAPLAQSAEQDRINLQDVFNELREEFNLKDSGKALKAVERAIAKGASK